MVNSLAVNYDPQLKSPDRQLKLGLEAIDISSDRRPARLGGDQRFHPGPLTEGHFDRVGATPAGEQLEEILLEKGRALGVVDVAGAVLEPEDLAGLRQVGEQRVVTGVLGVMRVKAACGPGHFTTGTDDGAVKVDSQTPKTELCDLLIEQFAVEAHQRAQRSLSKLLEPVDYRAVAGNTRQTAEPREQ